jgi:hypothetical protein
MTNYETQVQARTDELFDTLDRELGADLTPYDAAGSAYILDFEDGTSVLVTVEGYEPLDSGAMVLGDTRGDRL